MDGEDDGVYGVYGDRFNVYGFGIGVLVWWDVGFVFGVVRVFVDGLGELGGEIEEGLGWYVVI